MTRCELCLFFVPVHKLRPGDVKVTSALGDSITVCVNNCYLYHCVSLETLEGAQRNSLSIWKHSKYNHN